MVKDSCNRFCSKEQIILEVLDPIHRSLLLNNSKYEYLNYNNTTDTFNAPDVQSKIQARKPIEPQQQQQERENLIENKHLDDESYMRKPDVTSVCDSGGLMVLSDGNHFTHNSEYLVPPTDRTKNTNKMATMKNVRIRIATNKKYPSESMSSKKVVTPCYQYVETCSEFDSSNSSDEENAVQSQRCDNDHDFYKFNAFNNFDSSSTDDATSSDSYSPMIQITQEINEERIVTSTVHINKAKVKRFQSKCTTKVSPKEKTKWRNKQKIIEDNVCNEMLDETINDNGMKGDENVMEGDENVMEGEENATLKPLAELNTVRFGELKAPPKHSHRKMGKLLEKRLSRVLSENNNVKWRRPQQTDELQNPINISQSPKAKPPAKPPRTFASLSSKCSSDSVGGNTTTTLAIDDYHKAPTTYNTPQISPGWLTKVAIKPTCPSFDEINDFEKSKKIGWVSSIRKQEEHVNVLNMLNHENRTSSKITSANLMPELQFNIQSKEDIDQVDSHSPVKPIRRSKSGRSFDNSLPNSTPVKPSNQFSSFSAPTTMDREIDICKKCKLQVIKSSSTRKSFGKGAIKRTKLFLQASKNIWNRPKTPPKPTNKTCESDYELEDDIENEAPFRQKFNTTTEFNKNNTPRNKKKTVKKLELTPNYSPDDNIGETPKRIFNKFLTSVRRTPPTKPIRQSLIPKDVTQSPLNNSEENFNFNRIIDSPKSKEKGFKLSPRRLFRTNNETRPEVQQVNSYRSFETEQQDDLKQCIVEHLRVMNDAIDRTYGEERCQSLPRWQSYMPNFSTSSDAIDYVPQHQRVVQIDCHPEPIYSEIIPQAQTFSPKRIIVNNDPNAIYATIDKTKNRKTNESLSTDINEIQDATLETVSRRNSINQLYTSNSLADSILNMLDLMRQQREDGTEISSDVNNDEEIPSIRTKVTNFPTVETPTADFISELFQKSICKNDIMENNDNTSMETCFTESICDDVLRGDSVNNDIATMIDQLENLDLISNISLVEPEIDDVSTFDEKSQGTEDSGRETHTVSYCNIAEKDTKESTTLPSNENISHFDQISFQRKSTELQSSLLAAPSMIEIPDQYMLKLTDQIIAQREIRNQLNHAIRICRTTKEFECSIELVEAERLLLLSAKKEFYAKRELYRIDYEGNGLTANPVKCAGLIIVKKIEFALKPEELLENIFQLYYICVCSYRDQVVVSHAQERDGSKVIFDDLGLRISNLDSSFDIKIEVYVLRLPKILRKFSHESKYHSTKDSKRPLFINPVKLFSIPTQSPSKLSTDFEESRFRLRGVSTLSAKTLCTEKSEIIRSIAWPRNHVYVSCNTKSLDFQIKDQFANMTGPLQIDFIGEICLRDSKLAGYLRVGTQCNTLQWRWCRLSGCTLEFWNDDIDCNNLKPSIFSIDLIKCTNDSFQLTDNGFTINIFNDKISGNDEKKQLNCYRISTKKSDLNLWLSELNRILKFIKDWNM